MTHAESLMRHLAGDAVDIGHAPPKIEEWLESLALPIDLKRMLQWSWPQTPIAIGNIEFTDPVGMFHFDRRDELIEDSLFPIGHGLNGDPFLIDFSLQSNPVGFLCLQELYGDNRIRDVFQPAFRSLASYLHRVMLGHYLPFDYYDAKDMVDFLREESEHEVFPPFPKIR
jgi:hypothetical protein